MMRLLMMGLVIFKFSAAFADATRSVDYPALEQTGRASATEVLRTFDRANGPAMPGCFTCAGEDAAPASCRDAYADYYSKSTLDFRITLGYTDVGVSDVDHGPIKRVDAEDGPRRAAFVDRLLRKCPPNAVGTCGFEADPRDGEHFIKRNVLGPDGQPHTVNLHLVSSSVSMDDHANRLAHDPRLSPEENAHRLAEIQARQSERARRNFMVDGMHADFNAYAGHARMDGGPSFSPPPFHKNTLAVDESAFSHHDSKNEMLNVLRGNSHPPKIIGVFACNSTKWFADDIRKATKDASGKNLTGVLTSQGLSDPEIVFGQAYTALDSVLALRCKTEFTQAMNSVKNIWHTYGRGVQMLGLFDDPHPASAASSVAPQTPLAEDPAAADRFRSEIPLAPQNLIHPANGTTQTAPPVSKDQGAGSVN